MRQTIRTTLASLILLLSLAAPAAAAQFEEGADAYEREDYTTALHIWHQLADQGEAAAMYGLADMYENVREIKNMEEAVRWFRMAAEQNHATSQNNLGRMYASGFGVSQNPAQAARWFRMAAEQGHAGARNYLRLLCLPAQGRYTLPSSCNGGLGTPNPN